MHGPRHRWDWERAKTADLGEVMAYLVDAASSRSLIPIMLDIEGETEQLPNDVRVALYRVAQEALNNVFKHAKATEAAVELRISANGAELIIIDDGVSDSNQIGSRVIMRGFGSWQNGPMRLMLN